MDATPCCLSLHRLTPYIGFMKSRSSWIFAGKIAAAVIALAGATGAAFAAWVDNGDEIFVSMVQAGLAWCM